jgi:peptidoglycan/xylan/chitin deacetylase (PgdA/CDA1 family)
MLAFDDVTEGQYTNAFPILRKYRQKGVFYVTSSRSSISAAQLSEMAHAEMVIGSHGATHVDLAKTDDVSVLGTEISGSKSALQSMTGIPVTSIAYPGCVADSEAIGVVGGSGYLTGFSCGRSVDHYFGSRLMLSRVHVFNDMDSFTKMLSGIN